MKPGALLDAYKAKKASKKPEVKQAKRTLKNVLRRKVKGLV
jgi:hypothetical protein